MGNDDSFGHRMQLFSNTGYLLAITEGGEIYGTREESDSNTHLELSSAGDNSHVRIQSRTTQLYVCFGEDGQLYGEADVDIPGTVFIENLLGDYSVYRSKINSDWYIGIKKNGRPKNGHRTKLGQKATTFLPTARSYA